MADVNWAHGSLVTPETPPEPSSLGDDDSIAALLDAAEDIINDAVPGTLADLDAERRERKGGRLRRTIGKRGGASSDSTAKPAKNKPAKNKAPKNKPPKGSGEGLGERFRRRYRDGH